MFSKVKFFSNPVSISPYPTFIHWYDGLGKPLAPQERFAQFPSTTDIESGCFVILTGSTTQKLAIKKPVNSSLQWSKMENAWGGKGLHRGALRNQQLHLLKVPLASNLFYTMRKQQLISVSIHTGRKQNWRRKSKILNTASKTVWSFES